MNNYNNASDDGMETTEQESQTNDWMEMMQMQQRQQREQAAAQFNNARQAQALQMLGGFGAVIGANQQQRQQMANMKNDVLSSLCIMARRNKGFVPAETLGAVSRYLGKQITGAGYDRGNLVLTSPSVIQDPKTGQKFTDPFSPFAVVGKEQQFRALQNSRLAPDMQKEIYDSMVLDGITPDQLSRNGIFDPAGSNNVHRNAVQNAYSEALNRSYANVDEAYEALAGMQLRSANASGYGGRTNAESATNNKRNHK